MSIEKFYLVIIDANSISYVSPYYIRKNKPLFCNCLSHNYYESMLDVVIVI